MDALTVTGLLENGGPMVVLAYTIWQMFKKYASAQESRIKVLEDHMSKCDQRNDELQKDMRELQSKVIDKLDRKE